MTGFFDSWVKKFRDDIKNNNIVVGYLDPLSRFPHHKCFNEMTELSAFLKTIEKDLVKNLYINQQKTPLPID